MNTIPLLTGATATTSQGDNVNNIQNRNSKEYGLFQVDITGGTGTVVLYGRTTPAMSWVVVGTYTASGAERVSLFPQMEAVISAISGATVNAVLVE